MSYVKGQMSNDRSSAGILPAFPQVRRHPACFSVREAGKMPALRF
jgi:hypothetical protein